MTGLSAPARPYRDKVKLTFAHGAAVPDPTGQFNSSLDGKTRRAIDPREGDDIDEDALKSPIRAAITHNAAHRKK